MYANKRQIALNTPEQPGGISPPLTPLEALNKPRWTQLSVDLHHSMAAGIRHSPYITLCCLPAHHSCCGESTPHRCTRRHTYSCTPLSLCPSLVPSPLKRHTGGCTPLDMWACILTLETEDGHGCTL